MQVTVHLHTILGRQTSAGYQRKLTLTLPAGSTVADVLRELDISLPLDALLLVVAGRSVAPDLRLNDQDDVHLMPAMSGGASAAERARIEQAIAALEAQRPVLGAGVVETALIALRQQLAALAPPDPPTRTRKLATILFVDIVDSTLIVRDMDPEDNLDLMGTALRQLAAVVAAHGGRVHRFMGDGLMAVFGHPLAREDDPNRAVLCGLALLARAAEYADEAADRWGITHFQVRVGINTGPVVLLAESIAEETIMGVAVNLAARVESAASPGTLLISQQTYQHIRGAFDLTALPAITAKGFVEPVPVYQVLGAKPRSFRTRRRGVEGLETRMIGRTDALAQVQEAHAAVIQDGTAQFVTVIGEAGIGKSRLLYEFESWVDLQAIDFTLFRGRARLESARPPFGLLRDLFAFRFDIQDDDPTAVVRQKMEAGFRQAHDAAVDVQATAPAPLATQAHFVAHLLGYHLGGQTHLTELAGDPQQFYNRAQAYLIDFFRCLAAAGPVLILLEDLHWADDSSLETLQALMLALRNRPVLIVGAARPELHERYPEWLGWLPDHHRVELTPLTATDSRRLVKEVLQLAPVIPDQLRDLVVVRAGGNPYYVEELIKMLVEDGVIIIGTDTWQIRPERLVDVQVPETLTGVLQARLERLPDDERITLQQAAVIGRVFWDDALVQLARARSAGVAGAIGPELAALEAKDMVFKRESSAFAGTAERIFKHAILHAVTYESVVRQARQAYHALVATWLISQSGERVGEYASVIADHLEQSGQGTAAVAYLRQAGAGALAAYANTEAAAYFARALALCPESALETRYDLLLPRIRALHLLGRRDEQQADLAQLAELADGLADPERRARAAHQLGLYLAITGDSGNAIAAAERTVALARQANNSLVEAHGHLAWGRVLWRLEKLSAAHEQLEEALRLARAAGAGGVEANALLNLGNVADDMGDSQTAERFYQAALALDRERGDKVAEGVALNNLGILAAQAGRFAEAKTRFEQALAAARLTGYRQAEGLALGNLGNVTADMGDFASSRTFLRQYLANAIEIRNRPGQAHALNGLGTANLGLGDYAAAADYFEQAATLHGILKQPLLSLESQAGWAQALLGQGKQAKARTLIEPILAHLDDATNDEHVESMSLYYDCILVLQANGDARAEPLLVTAYASLQAQAGRITDPAARGTFLTNVTANREIVALWAARTA